MKLHAVVVCAGVMFAGGCDRGEPQRGEPSEAARALGIDRIEVTKSPTELEIVGLDAKGQGIARVDLSVGRFTFTEEADRGEVFGRRMTVNVLGEDVTHESEGTTRLALPLALRSPRIKAFLLDDQVSAELSRWGVGFDTSPEPIDLAKLLGAETSYGCNTVTAGPSLSASCYTVGCGTETYTYTSCVQFNPNEMYGLTGEFRCCPSGNAAERRCGAAAEGDPTQCGPAGKYGCGVCWIASAPGGCYAYLNEGQDTANMQYCN